MNRFSLLTIMPHPGVLIAVLISIFITLDGFSQRVTIHYTGDHPAVSFGISKLESALKTSGYDVQRIPGKSEFTIAVSLDKNDPALRKEGYRIQVEKNEIKIISGDATGAMYGAFDLAEQFEMGKSWKEITSHTSNPHFSVRALKFNLPWSPYRTGKVMEQHTAVCKDLAFWQSFLDQMALNRFNVLSLWNVHPFSFMVKPVHFPAANTFTAAEMKDWKYFWTALFRMAKERGIETFIVNWNIAVSPEFAAAYHVQERNDTSALVKRYTREVVTQVINEYPDLSGIGITLADWMSNFDASGSTLPKMTAKDREDWIEETVVAGIKAANHPVKFLHRSVLSSDPKAMRNVIDNARLADTTLVEVKFNWSHGHSTPLLALTHDSHSGKIDNGYWEPMPDNYRIQWMVRNEDFFILRWGEPEFIRQHIRKNSDAYVNGYFVGSEGYIPAKDYVHVSNAHRTWKYAFEKQWLFYTTWGRLLYDPTCPDRIFEAAFDKRYGKGVGKSMLKASAAAGKMPLRLASFHAGTWDYTLYSEGFLSPFSAHGEDDKVSSFISITELINHPTLDPRYCSIADYVKVIVNKTEVNSITPLQLADSLENDSRSVINMVRLLRKSPLPALHCELDDLETWAYLGFYFSDKLRAGVSLEMFRTNHQIQHQQSSIASLKRCLEHWQKVVDLTQGHYQEVLYLDDQSTQRQPNTDAHTFSWAKYTAQVQRDIDIVERTK